MDRGRKILLKLIFLWSQIIAPCHPLGEQTTALDTLVSDSSPTEILASRTTITDILGSSTTTIVNVSSTTDSLDGIGSHRTEMTAATMLSTNTTSQVTGSTRYVMGLSVITSNDAITLPDDAKLSFETSSEVTGLSREMTSDVTRLSRNMDDITRLSHGTTADVTGLSRETSDVTDPSTDDVNATTLVQKAAPDALGKYVSYVITPLLVCLGVSGNALTVVVMQSDAFASMTMGMILTALAFSDTTVLLMQPFSKPWIIHLFGTDVRAISDAACKIFFIIIRTAKMCSTWFIVLVCAQRLIAVFSPLRSKLINTKRRTILEMFIILTALSIFNGFWSFSSKVVDGKICMAHKTEPSIKSKVISVTGVITYGAMPTFLLCIMTPAIIFKILQQSRVRRKLTNTARNKSEPSEKTVAMLLSVIAAYIILAIPISVVYVMSVTSGRKPYTSTDPMLSTIREIAQALELLNYSVNFFLYVGSSKVFRNRVVEIVGCKNVSPKE